MGEGGSSKLHPSSMVLHGDRLALSALFLSKMTFWWLLVILRDASGCFVELVFWLMAFQNFSNSFLSNSFWWSRLGIPSCKTTESKHEGGLSETLVWTAWLRWYVASFLCETLQQRRSPEKTSSQPLREETSHQLKRLSTTGSGSSVG